MAVQFKDYYETLGVAKNASPEEVKKAFRRLSLQYHPDKAKGDKKKAEEKFKDINEAYEVLGDPEKRRKYDQLGAGWQQHGGVPPGWEGARDPRGATGGGEGFEFHFDGTGFSDFFEQFFGGNRGRGGFTGFEEFGFDPRGHNPTAQRGQDIEGDILVSIEEALRGAAREVKVRRTDPRTGQSETQTYRVRIPAGVHEGQRIRLAGRGHEGGGGGAAGDLYLRVRFAQHPDLRVQNSDLYYDLVLAPWEAVLGAKVTVPTLDGPAALTVPAGTTSGQKLRLRGRGMPGVNGQRGDLYAVVSVDVPTRANPEEKGLWEQLRVKSGYNPRGQP